MTQQRPQKQKNQLPAKSGSLNIDPDQVRSDVAKLQTCLWPNNANYVNGFSRGHPNLECHNSIWKEISVTLILHFYIQSQPVYTGSGALVMSDTVYSCF